MWSFKTWGEITYSVHSGYTHPVHSGYVMHVMYVMQGGSRIIFEGGSASREPHWNSRKPEKKTKTRIVSGLIILKVNTVIRTHCWNTFTGIETRFKKQLYPVLVSTTHVKELNCIEQVDEGIKVGASVTLAALDNALKDAITSLPGEKTFTFYSHLYVLLRHRLLFATFTSPSYLSFLTSPCLTSFTSSSPLSSLLSPFFYTVIAIFLLILENYFRLIK